MRKRSAVYKSPEGDYLMVYESLHCFYIAWETEFGEGLSLGEHIHDPAADTERAVEAATQFCASRGLDTQQGKRIEFDSLNVAEECLRFVNAALLAGAPVKPMPKWATTALANGWKAPKGWKP